ncbi:helix-turn-helix domain-containing protein [Bacillus altitudinis]|uniref:helix-turn-helix domain-containing protein n=1 Tax=Bacillus altitudinis TaxID=293387 RepID=UPI00366D1806
MQETTQSDTRIVVKMLAQERNVTMKSIASALGIGTQRLNKILDNETTPAQMETIAETIGVHPEDITEICRLMKLDPNYHAPKGGSDEKANR